MAKIVLGLASSHTPQLSIPASSWPLLREKDESDPRLDYADLLSKAPPDIDQLTRIAVNEANVLVLCLVLVLGLVVAGQ